MPNDYRTNAMQANVGLGFGAPAATNIMTPAEMSIKLTEQATQRSAQSSNILRGNTLGMPSVASFSAQYQQELQRIQSQQSMSPYMAQAMAQMTPSSSQYQQGVLPSPLSMTPPSTGGFRPPPQPFAAAPIPQMTLPPPAFTPFSPQMPAPMFASPMDQALRMQDVRANQGFAMASQVPGMVGQAGAMMGGAALGARMGGAFGPMGRVMGALGGAAFTGMSGLASGIGDMMQLPMQPAIQRREMGAALQRTSQNWVVGGPQVHQLGSGLSRDASIDLAGGIQDMAGDSGFQKQTGNMFNSQDLMRITQTAGKSGLMDMAQSVPQIKNKLRETAQTIKQFMEITHDPDVTNVIRQMGQMRQMGMTQQDMVSAAQGMKTYARQAGTSQQGLQQMGGLPGAMTFNQAGMTAATGFNYGNYAAATSRQFVASGGVSARELALMGGVQGMTQRDIQSQAAMAAMPLYGAANAQFSGGQWGLNQSAVGGSQGGAFGMVRGALAAANQGMQSGGLGALAMLPMQQREIGDLAMRNMSSEQAMAQKFSMVQSTADELGLGGSAGFGAIAKHMYGPDVGNQMWRQAKSPEFWSSQRQQVRQRKDALARKQAAQRRASRGTLETVGDFVGAGGIGRDLGQAWDDIDMSFGIDIGGTISRKAGGMVDDVGDFFDDMMVGDGIVRRNIPKSAAIDSAEERAGLVAYAKSKGKGYSASVAGGPDFAKARQSGLGISDLPNLGRAMNYQSGMQGVAGAGAQVGGGLLNVAASIGLRFPGDYGGQSIAQGMQGGLELLTEGSDSARATLRRADVERAQTRQLLRGAKRLTASDEDKVYSILKKSKGEGAGKAMSAMGDRMAKRLDKEGRTSLGASLTSGDDWGRRWDALTSGNIGGAFQTASSKDLTKGEIERRVRESSGLSPADWAKLKPDEKRTMMEYGLKEAGASDEDAADFLRSTESAASADLAESADMAAELTAEAYEESTEKLEKKLGITGDWFDSSGADDFREQLQSKQSVPETVMMAAVAGGEGQYDEAKKLWAQMGGKGGDKAFRKEWKKSQARLRASSKDVQKLYKGMTAGGGTLADVKALADQRKEQPTTEALRSFAGQLEDYADPTMATGLQRKVGTISGQDIANTISEEGLVKMANEKGGLKRAQMYAAAQRGNKQAMAQIEQMAAEDAATGRNQDEAAVSAGGKEARQLDADATTMQNMSAMFQDFKPAVKDFRKGAEDFREAMEADAYSRRTE